MSIPNPNATHISTTINENDRGASITLAASLGLGFSLFFLLSRFFTRWPLRNFFKIDDAATTVATVLAIGQVLAVTIAVNYGLGERQSRLQESKLRSMYKAVFASDILFLAALGLAKLAFVSLIYRLTNKTKHRRTAHICFGIIVSWTLLSIVLMSIPCHGQFSWVSLDATCPFMSSKSIAITTLDVITEISLLVLPTYFLWKVQIKRSTRIFALLIFWTRICLPVFSICRLHQILRLQASEDYTFGAVRPAIMTQILMHAALVFATVPIISPILKTFNTGFLVPDAGHIDGSRRSTNASGPSESPCKESGASNTNTKSISSLFGRAGHFIRAKSTSKSDTTTSPSATLPSAANERPGTIEISPTRSRSPFLPSEVNFKVGDDEGERNKASEKRYGMSNALGLLQPNHFEYETTIKSSRVRCPHSADGMMRLPANGMMGRKDSPNRYRGIANRGVGSNQKRRSNCQDDVGNSNDDKHNDGNILSVHTGNDQMFIHRTVDVNFYDKEEAKGNADG